MKKNLILFPIIMMTAACVVGCERSQKPRVTFGTLVDKAATELRYNELQVKIANKENMLISVYADGLPCGCWSTFHTIIDQYVDKYDTRIYYIARSQFSEDADNFGLSILPYESTNPTFAFVKEGKKANEYIYGTDTKTMFETLDGLRSAVTRIARDPQFMYVNQSYLDSALFIERKDRVAVHYVWSFCPDCNDCFPYVMIPYSQKHDFKTNIWIIDLAIEGLLLQDGKMNKTNPNYVKFLKDHHMSAEGDSYFGYDRGFVPTTQIWENGTLINMNVYFNDEISFKDGKYYVSRSYYSQENVSKFKYTDTVLEGMEVNVQDLDIDEESGSASWKKDSARIYHKPILESFLNTYIKK